jgi:CRP-like cAMP-binding protein
MMSQDPGAEKMSRIFSARHANLLLRRMSAVDAMLLEPWLHRERLDLGQYLVHAGKPIEHLYFLNSGIASLISARPDGVQVELAVIGKEGVTGIAALMGAESAPYDTLIQVDHAFADRIEISRMLTAMDASPTLRRLMLRYVQTVLVQMSGNAAANVSDRIAERLARWLLMCHDRVEGDEIAITHEFMARMIGAPRTAVTATLHELEGLGLIRGLRRRVLVANRTRLEEFAGAAYGAPEQEYRRLVGPFGKSAGLLSATTNELVL